MCEDYIYILGKNMSLGNSIKELRKKFNLTQKELADQLHVTPQAVSRWENNEVEPSIETIRSMATIFKISLDELLNYNPVEEKAEVEVIERIIQAQPVLAVCEKCNKPIYEGDQIVRKPNSFGKDAIFCKTCDEKAEEINRTLRLEGGLKRRKLSFIIPLILFAIIFISSLFNKDKESIFGGIVLAILIFTFVACLILNNNFIADLWMTVASWGFKTMQGIIFSFSIGGLISFIVIKIILFLFSIFLALGALMLATGLAVFLSIFAYPFAIAKSFKNPELSYE